MSTNIDVFHELRSTLVQQIAQAMQQALPMYARLPLDYIQERVGVSLNALEQDLVEKTQTQYQTFWHTMARQRAEEQTPINAILKVLRINTTTIIQTVKQHLHEHQTALIEFLEALHTLTESAIEGIYHGYADYHSAVMQQQSQTLQELSTPIIPIHEGILVVPLIGAIDSQRAMNMMEILLEGINSYQADVIILDITGVPVLDTGVANHLLHTARAVRLLGSQIVLVGIGAEIAQTIVQLGIDLQDITTRANLQAGVEYALGLQNLMIASLA